MSTRILNADRVSVVSSGYATGSGYGTLADCVDTDKSSPRSNFYLYGGNRYVGVTLSSEKYCRGVEIFGVNNDNSATNNAYLRYKDGQGNIQTLCALPSWSGSALVTIYAPDETAWIRSSYWDIYSEYSQSWYLPTLTFLSDTPPSTAQADQAASGGQ